MLLGSLKTQDKFCGLLKSIETFAKPINPAIPISSRRYLFAYGCVVKYLEFAEKVANSYGLMEVNSNI